MADTNLVMSLDIGVFTEADFAAAFNEWSRRCRENPVAMDNWMNSYLEHHNNDEGRACSTLVFSILHDLKKGNP